MAQPTQNTVHAQQFMDALRAAGFPLPADCRWAEIHFGIDEAMTVRFDVYVRRDQLPLIAKAFVDLAKSYGDDIITNLPDRPDRPAGGRPDIGLPQPPLRPGNELPTPPLRPDIGLPTPPTIPSKPDHGLPEEPPLMTLLPELPDAR